MHIYGEGAALIYMYVFKHTEARFLLISLCLRVAQMPTSQDLVIFMPTTMTTTTTTDIQTDCFTSCACMRDKNNITILTFARFSGKGRHSLH